MPREQLDADYQLRRAADELWTAELDLRAALLEYQGWWESVPPFRLEHNPGSLEERVAEILGEQG